MSNKKRFHKFLWLIPLFLLFHFIEELPSFPSWANQHFGTITTPSFFFYSHLPLFGLILLFCYDATKNPNKDRGVFLCVSTQMALLVNGLFHLITTILFKEYSPGVVTGVILYFPFSIYLFQRVLRERRITQWKFVSASLLGTFIMVLIIGSLWLN